MQSTGKADAPSGQKGQRGGQRGPQQSSGMNFAASSPPMLFPGYPERMLQWFERLHTAVALNVRFHKDVVKNREYQDRPTVVVTVEEITVMDSNPLVKKQLETRYALHETRLQQMEDAKREIFDFIWSHLSDRSQEWVRKHHGDDLDPDAPLIRAIEHTHSLKNFSGVRSQPIRRHAVLPEPEAIPT